MGRKYQRHSIGEVTNLFLVSSDGKNYQVVYIYMCMCMYIYMVTCMIMYIYTHIFIDVHTQLGYKYIYIYDAYTHKICLYTIGLYITYIYKLYVIYDMLIFFHTISESH